ncbi:hypothetical protein OSB04_023161 [Centaurea solstitialis]|uniref:G3BP-like protein n=1 Tax=Centaurea solstitialis TaxID=347529 RepID=A0AA38WAS8_9ASTR|nr:hypothetical protein OSB04_023161 [Centaurea solstitialis]
MAAPAAAPQQPVPAQVVGNAFVQQYYHILHQSPGLVHRFYQDLSKLGRPEEDGSMSITTTMDAINSKILSLNYDEFRAEIKSVDAQESLNGGVNVLVTGYLTGKDNVLRNFTQSFFLAPQDKGFYVLNDMFRYMENANHNEGNTAPVEDVEAPANPEQGNVWYLDEIKQDKTEHVKIEQNSCLVFVPKSAPVQENHIPDPAPAPAPAPVPVPTEEPEEEVFNPPENVEVAVVEEEEPVPEVVDEVQEASQLVVESNTKIEEVPKKSYASIVMDLKQNDVPFSSPAPAPRKPQPRSQEQQVNNAQPIVSATEVVASNVDAVENGIHEEEADGYSIYIKGLPMSATPALLEDEFKKFGPIKPNGIQVRSNRKPLWQQQGFCFGFVEFEVPEAVQKAIEASPVAMGTRHAVVEEKRSTNSKGKFFLLLDIERNHIIEKIFNIYKGFKTGGARGRFPIGRGSGFRNEGMRGGRGNFGGGGRGYNNRGGDFGGGRNDYGSNRGGGRGGAPPSRGGGGDGYQRERMNRGMGVNGTAKNMAPRVPATA